MKVVVTLLMVFYCLNIIHGQDQWPDAASPKVLCSNEPLVIQILDGPGLDATENLDLPCLKQPFPETNVVWLKWQISSGGSLGYTILPLDQADDIDFVLYRLYGKIDDYNNRIAIRCMASGQSLGEDTSFVASINCTGATGLRTSEIDESELQGCQADDNNFLAEIQAKPGETYLLFINNFHSSQGLMVEFTGTATFNPEIEPCAAAVTDDNQPLDNLPDDGLRISQIFPNPSEQMISTNIAADKHIEGFLHIINVQGQTLKTFPLDITTGEATYSFDVSGLQKGVYFLKFRFGDSLMVQRFAKM